MAPLLDQVQKFSQQFEEHYDKHCLIGFEKQTRFAALVEPYNWEANLDKCLISFDGLGDFRVFVVGTLTEEAFVLADENNAIKFGHDLTGDLMHFVKGMHIPEFDQGRVEFEEVEGCDIWFHKLTCLLVSVFPGALGMYRVSGVSLLVCRPIEPLVVAEASREELLFNSCSRFEQLLHPLCCPKNHFTCWTEYFARHGIPVSIQGRKITVENSSFAVTFDDNDCVARIDKIKTEI